MRFHSEPATAFKGTSERAELANIVHRQLKQLTYVVFIFVMFSFGLVSHRAARLRCPTKTSVYCDWKKTGKVRAGFSSTRIGFALAEPE